VRSPIDVRPVTTPQDRIDWVRFPRQHVYSAASPWVPPLDRDVGRVLDRAANPFYQHGDATAFLARGPAGQPLGRILAQVYRRHNERHDERTAFFGYFECQDDEATARALIRAAAQAGARWGCTVLRGPFNMTAMQEMGIVVDGFEHPPAVDQTYTPPYYPELLGGAGLHAVFPHTTYRIDDVRSVDLDALLGEPHRVLTVERRLRIRSAQMHQFGRELEILRVLLNDSFAALTHFVPLTAEELAFQVGAYQSFVDPSLLLVAEMDGVPRGFVLAVPDFNPLLKRLDGRLDLAQIAKTVPTAAGWLWRRDACLIIQGVERRLQGIGIMRLLHERLIRNLRRRRYRGLSVTWIDEQNRRSAASVQALGARPQHRLTLFEGAISSLT
jgi:hypothetical protein